MNDKVRLPNVEPNDLPVFYEQQLDPDATHMAAFPARDRASIDAHWEKNILANSAAITQTILVDGEVAGNIGSWPQEGMRLVGYWIGKEYWGKGCDPGAHRFPASSDRSSALRSRSEAQRWLNPRPGEVWLHCRTDR